MLRCAVVGGSGYTGAELVALLAAHPEVDLVSVHAEGSAGEAWEDLHPGRRHLFRGRLQPFSPGDLAGLDAVLLALPHEASARAAESLLGTVASVIDLSGGLRLGDAAAYRTWYGHEHPAPRLLGRAVYGLPELFGHDLPGADLVACAGCYATTIQLAAAPALKLPGMEPAAQAWAASGSTGAGRKADLALSFSELFGDLRPYRVGRHQHVPEMTAGLSRVAGRPVSVSFVPHLAPVARGIVASVALRSDRPLQAAVVKAAWHEFYADCPLVRVLDAEQRLPGLRDVVGTPYCDLAPVVDADGRTLVVSAALDNLMKGAASQAVQVLNRVFGLEERLGLARPAMEASAC